MDEIRSYYAERASELGINLSDPNDDIAEIVRIGLDDLDPTRVSKDCRHIHVMPTTHGIPAEMLGLPTAGSKRVVCLKHGHSTQHLKLDTAYNFFKQLWPLDQNEVRCDNCPDKAPHPEGWVWSSEWEKEQYARYLKLTKQDNSEQEGETENK